MKVVASSRGGTPGHGKLSKAEESFVSVLKAPIFHPWPENGTVFSTVHLTVYPRSRRLLESRQKITPCDLGRSGLGTEGCSFQLSAPCSGLDSNRQVDTWRNWWLLLRILWCVAWCFFDAPCGSSKRRRWPPQCCCTWKFWKRPLRHALQNLSAVLAQFSSRWWRDNDVHILNDLSKVTCKNLKLENSVELSYFDPFKWFVQQFVLFSSSLAFKWRRVAVVAGGKRSKCTCRHQQLPCLAAIKQRLKETLPSARQLVQEQTCNGDKLELDHHFMSC